VGSLFGIALMVLLPLLVSEVLNGASPAFGFLAAAFGAGSLLGAAYVAGYTGGGRLQWLIAVGIALVGVGLLGLGLAQTLWLAILFCGVAGFGAQLLITGTSTVIQMHADDDKRGRVVSWYSTAFNGAIPFGSLGAGALAALVGPSSTLLVGAAACLLAAAAASYRLAGFGLHVPGRGKPARLPPPPRPVA
jgi:MFS family permease